LSVAAAVVAESDVVGAAFEAPDAELLDDAATGAFTIVVFGATGAVAATVHATSVALVGVSCGLTVLAIASPAAA
jgi:hypothetical protein